MMNWLTMWGPMLMVYPAAQLVLIPEVPEPLAAADAPPAPKGL